MLLSHTSGLPLEVAPERYVWREGLSWRDLAHACLETPLQFAPRERVQYSNVGYGLLAQMIERITGRELADALHEMVIAPLGIEAYLGRAELPRPSAAIMDVDSEYAGTEMEPCNSAFWRRLALPWAGMITTIDGLMTLLRVYADPREDLISSATLREAMTNQTGELGGGFGTTDPFLATRPSRPITWPRCAWGLMLELHGEKRPHWAPPAASAGSFGQIGSTGCLAWYDPERGAAWAFMGTRTTDSGWLLRYGMALGNVALRQGAPRLAGAAADARAVQGCS
jgi:beta-lactamase class C